jgi:hypothetical protein
MIFHVYYNVNIEMGTVYKKNTAIKDKHDFDQGLRCLAYLIAQAYLHKERERLAGEKTLQEGNNGDG